MCLFNSHKRSNGNLNRRKKRSVPNFTPPHKLIFSRCSPSFSLPVLEYWSFTNPWSLHWCFQDMVLFISWSISFPLPLFCCSSHTIDFFFFVIINSELCWEGLQLSKHFHANYRVNRTRFIYFQDSFVLSYVKYLSRDLSRKQCLEPWDVRTGETQVQFLWCNNSEFRQM